MGVGLDLSLSSTGYHTLAGELVSGSIDTDEKLSSMARIDFILAKIAEIVHEGDFVLIENNAFHALGSAKSKLAELNGIVKFWLWRRKIDYILVAPTTLKKFILGKGKGEKSFIVREVFKAYGLNAGTDDEADACVLAHIGACLIGAEEPRNLAQREVLSRLAGGPEPQAVRASGRRKAKGSPGCSAAAG